MDIPTKRLSVQFAENVRNQPFREHMREAHEQDIFCSADAAHGGIFFKRAAHDEFRDDVGGHPVALVAFHHRDGPCYPVAVCRIVRGVFLACGSVTAPEKEYHLEFSISSKNLAVDFMKLFDAYNDLDAEQTFTLQPRLSARGGVYVVYFKDSTSIEDFLTLTGAQNAALRVMNAKVFKNIKNNVNRRTNFEMANLDRSVNAAAQQVDAIRRILRHNALSLLPEDTAQLALLRMQEQEMSLRELGEAMKPPMSRTAVNYRLKKILEFAKQFPDE